jgi:hypothetical protein
MTDNSYDHVERSRQHLLATLRAAEQPISTAELVNTHPLEIAPWYDDPYSPSYSNIYARLRQLEDRGQVRRVRMGGGRVGFQAVLSDGDRATFDALVASLANGAS